MKRMKLENGVALGAAAVALVTFGALDAPAWITVLGVAAAAFLGWQTGCLIEIIRENRVKDPQPNEKPDVEITMWKQQPDGSYRKTTEKGNYQDFI